MEDIQERFYGGESQAREAFEELSAMVTAMLVNIQILEKLSTDDLLTTHHQEEKEERREAARSKLTHLREANGVLKERNAKLRAKYAAMVDA